MVNGVVRRPGGHSPPRLVRPSSVRRVGFPPAILRSVYDPAIAATLERHGELGRDFATAGPVAVNGTWSRIRTDSAHHAVLWISEWPHSMAYPGFLSPILLFSGIQRSFSLIRAPCAPIRPLATSARRKSSTSPTKPNAPKSGQSRTPPRRLNTTMFSKQDADLTAGRGILRYTGLITITATTIEDLDAHDAALEQAAIQANCETRLLAGQQAKVFTAAALPLSRQV